MPRSIFRVLAALVAGLGASAVFAADVPITAVPQARQPASLVKSAPAALMLPTAAPGAVIALDPPSAAELTAFRALNAKSAAVGATRSGTGKGHPLAIGFTRPVPAAMQSIALAAVPWQDAGNGLRAARIEVRSPGAEGLRVALRFDGGTPDLSVRLTGSLPGSPVVGPVAATAIRAANDKYGVYWSPDLPGEAAVVELTVRAGVDLGGQRLAVPRVTHQVVPRAEFGKISAKRLSDIGGSLPCEIDLQCVSPVSPALAAAASAVAAITFNQDDGGLYLCSGQLLNDSLGDNTPNFFTANHCINSALAASTINTYWFFDATSCGSGTVRSDYVLQSAGAQLLARSPDWDWALVRLNAPPPAGATFAAWRAEAVPNGAILTVLHHPSGDLKKFSQGTAGGYVADSTYSLPTPATFLYMTYTDGQTEAGSSGSAVWTFNPVGFYEVRGALFNGLNPSCPRPANYFDVYSRLDNMVPVVREYLTPDNNPGDTVAAVEFYNRTLDHYFLSTNPAEIRDLDIGVHQGWVRTGLRFNAYATPHAGTSPVCRYYRAPAYGDSHFYSASPAECAATGVAHPNDWIFESPAVFYIGLPDPTAGSCAFGTRPIWRFFNQFTTNHRYTAEVKERDAMRGDSATWIAEGYGPDAVIMCSPLGG